ncbi:MAG: DNA primase [Ignavibacteriaceae bacterium]|nr:DNA primase [Ignavibacteriaceae bacterium]
MNTNYTQKEGDKSYVKLKNKINELPTEKVAEKLGLELTKNGNSYQGECPTGHSSEGGKCFSINSIDKYWKCFHCEKGGDNIELIKIARKVDFLAAIRWAAKEFNISHNVDFNNPFGKELSDEEKEKIRVFNTRAELFETAFEWMHELLFTEDGKNVLDYLVNKRGYNAGVLKKSEFCYFPPASEIKKYLLEKHPDNENDINNLPLFGSTGDSYRLALPYRNAFGKITGFIKRATPGAVKYKTNKNGKPVEERYDSTASLKKDDIFNLHKCRNLGTIILFEGYPDATYFYAAGMKNATAVGQGRLSQKHLEGLRTTKVKNVVISFDNDKVKDEDIDESKDAGKLGKQEGPGILNTEEAVRLILNESEITPFVLDPKLLEPHKDPDEYFRANGFKATQDLYKKVKKGIIWLAERILEGLDKDDYLSRQNARDELLHLTTLTSDAQDIAEIKKMMLDKLGLEKSLVNELFKEKKTKTRIEKYKKIKNAKLNGRKRYFPFIERSTSSYSYLDTKKDEIYMGVPKDILENILISGGEPMPDVFPVLEADFDVKINDRIDYENEKINLFVPTSYMLMNKTAETFHPRIDFSNIYKLLINLIPNYRERKRFLNWLAGILQTREKQLTAWVLKGEQGAGKGIFLDKVLKEIFGRRQSVKVEDSDLQSDFNPWLKNTIIVAFNEVAHDNSTRNNIKSRIKAIITDPDVMINEKNIRNYFITNYVNCLFFSNEKVPLFIEDKDRRLNVVTTGPNLISFPWFKKDPEGFINSLKPEVPKFAQFLMNWKYDPVAAKTCIENEEKRAMVSVALNKFEEFAIRLKNKDLEWFEENIIYSDFDYNQDFLGKKPLLKLTAQDLEGRIRKDLALQVFNRIYTNQQVNNMQLGRSLKLYGIRSERSRKVGDDNWYYAWD